MTAKCDKLNTLSSSLGHYSGLVDLVPEVYTCKIYLQRMGKTSWCGCECKQAHMHGESGDNG